MDACANFVLCISDLLAEGHALDTPNPQEFPPGLSKNISKNPLTFAQNLSKKKKKKGCLG